MTLFDSLQERLLLSTGDVAWPRIFSSQLVVASCRFEAVFRDLSDPLLPRFNYHGDQKLLALGTTLVPSQNQDCLADQLKLICMVQDRSSPCPVISWSRAGPSGRHGKLLMYSTKSFARCKCCGMPRRIAVAQGTNPERSHKSHESHCSSW